MCRLFKNKIYLCIVQLVITILLSFNINADKFTSLESYSLFSLLLFINLIIHYKNNISIYKSYVLKTTGVLTINFIVSFIIFNNTITDSTYLTNVNTYLIFIIINILMGTLIFNLKYIINKPFIIMFVSFGLYPVLFNYIYSYQLNDINIFISLSFVIFFCSISYFSKKISLILYSIIYITIFIYFNAQYIHYNILNDFFSFFEVYNFQEALPYISFIKGNINLELIVIDFVLLSCFMVTIKAIYSNYSTKNVKVIIKLVLIAIIFKIIGVGLIYFSDINRYISVFYNTTTLYSDFQNIDSKQEYLDNFGLYQYIYCDLKNLVFNSSSINNEDLYNFVLEKKKMSRLKSNDHTNLLKDENIIFVLGETIDTWILEDAMPTLKYMKNTGIDFQNYFAMHYNGGRTLNSEFAINTGFFIPTSYNIYESVNNEFDYSLASLFNNNGYVTTYIHANSGKFYGRQDFMKSYGYHNAYYLLDKYNSIKYLDDRKLIDDSIYNLYIDKDHKFMSFITTYSGHGDYIDNKFCKSENIQNEYECYAHVVSYTDDFLKNLIDKLNKDDLLDRTTIVFIGDHYAYGYKDEEYVKNRKNVSKLEYNIDKVPFIIWNNRINSEYNIKMADIVDILPTITNMLGFDYKPEFYTGEDIFSESFNQYLITKDNSLVGYNLDAISKYVYENKDYGSNVIKYNFSLNDLNMLK